MEKEDFEKIDLNKWTKICETENFIEFQAKTKWLIWTRTDSLDVLILCEIFRKKGYKPHLEEYTFDGTIIFERKQNEK